MVYQLGFVLLLFSDINIWTVLDWNYSQDGSKCWTILTTRIINAPLPNMNNAEIYVRCQMWLD